MFENFSWIFASWFGFTFNVFIKLMWIANKIDLPTSLHRFFYNIHVCLDARTAYNSKVFRWITKTWNQFSYKLIDFGKFEVKSNTKQFYSITIHFFWEKWVIISKTWKQQVWCLETQRPFHPARRNETNVIRTWIQRNTPFGCWGNGRRWIDELRLIQPFGYILSCNQTEDEDEWR